MKSVTHITAGHSRTCNCLSHSVPFQIVVDSDSLLAALPALLPFATDMNAGHVLDGETFLLMQPDRGRGFRFYLGPELRRENDKAAPVLEQFARDLMVHVANFCPNRVFIHAGVVGWRGRALVMPGTSFAGKTTLTAALVRAGATYYSDEYAVVDERGWVHPYARDLQMREPGQTDQRSVPVEDLRGQAGTVPLPVAQVILARHESGAQWNPQPISAGMAVLEMMRHCIPVQRTPARVMSSLTTMVESATAWSSTRGEADAVAESILHTLKPAEPVGTQRESLEQSLAL